MEYLHKNAFTLVELIVVITILAILGTIAYISLLGYNVLARDTVRVSDITTITKAIELSKLENGNFPPVSNASNVSFSGAIIWKQGSFGLESQRASKRISEVPHDPLTGNEYAYGLTQSTQEYQVGTILEKSPRLTSNFGVGTSYAADVNNILPEFVTTTVKGNYNGKYITYVEHVSTDEKNIYILGVPSILSKDILDTTLEQIHTQKGFIYQGGNNAPGVYSGKIQEKGWNFSPALISGTTNPTSNPVIIYQGTNQELSAAEGKIALVTNLKQYYASTPEVTTSTDFAVLNAIDPLNQSDKAIELINTYLRGGHGGLNGEIYKIQQNTATQSASAPMNCPLSEAESTTLNNWVNVTLFTEGGEGGSPIMVASAAPGTGVLTKEQWCSITHFSLEYGFSPVLSSIPEAFGKLPNLQAITFDNQNISQLPESISQLTQLTSIIFTGNTGLGNLNADFSPASSETCQDAVTPAGNRVCFIGNGTTISVTSTPGI